MSQGKALAVLVAGVLFGAAVAEGQPVATSLKYKTAKDMPAAGMYLDTTEFHPQASAILWPVDLEGQPAYFVRWWWIRYFGVAVGAEIEFVAGIAPTTCVKPRGPNGLSVELDLNQLLIVIGATRIVCIPYPPDGNRPPCAATRPVSVPLKGFFEPFDGLFSTTSHSNGSYQTVQVDLDATYTWSGGGQQIDQRANFTGTVGPVAVTPLASNGNAWINQRSGSSTFEALLKPLHWLLYTK